MLRETKRPAAASNPMPRFRNILPIVEKWAPLTKKKLLFLFFLTDRLVVYARHTEIQFSASASHVKSASNSTGRCLQTAQRGSGHHSTTSRIKLWITNKGLREFMMFLHGQWQSLCVCVFEKWDLFTGFKEQRNSFQTERSDSVMMGAQFPVGLGFYAAIISEDRLMSTAILLQ